MIAQQTFRRIHQLHGKRSRRTGLHTAAAAHTLCLVDAPSVNSLVYIILRLDRTKHAAGFFAQAAVNTFVQIDLCPEAGFGVIIPGLLGTSIIMHIRKHTTGCHIAVAQNVGIRCNPGVGLVHHVIVPGSVYKGLFFPGLLNNIKNLLPRILTGKSHIDQKLCCIVGLHAHKGILFRFRMTEPARALYNRQQFTGLQYSFIIFNRKQLWKILHRIIPGQNSSSGGIDPIRISRPGCLRGCFHSGRKLIFQKHLQHHIVGSSIAVPPHRTVLQIHPLYRICPDLGPHLRIGHHVGAEKPVHKLGIHLILVHSQLIRKSL